MANLMSIPTELVALIVDELDYASEVNAVAQTCHRLHDIANVRLYSFYAKRYSPHGLNRIVENGNVDAIEKLLSAGLNFDSAYYSHGTETETPLLLAASAGQVDIINAFVDVRGPSVVLKWGPQLLQDAAVNDHPNVVDLLLNMGVPVDEPTTGSNRRTALSFAAEEGSLESVKQLVGGGGNLDSHDNDHQTPLWWASKAGHLEVVKFFANAGADPTLESAQYPFMDPLYRAALDDQRAVVQYLLDQKAHPDLQSNLNCQALASVAVRERRKKDMILAVILDHVDMDAALRDSDEETRTYLLMCAAACGDHHLACEIHDMGSNILLRVDGYSTIEIAAARGHVQISRWLLLNLPGEGGQTLSLACESAIIEAAAGKHRGVLEMVFNLAGEESINVLGATPLISALHFPRLSQHLINKGILAAINQLADVHHVIREALLANDLDVVQRVLDSAGLHLWSDVGPIENDILN